MIQSNYPLKNISTIGLGGICKEFICPTSIDELLKIKLPKKKLFIGNGSNICFITDYYDGTIVSLKRMSKDISKKKHHNDLPATSIFAYKKLLA